MENDVKTMTKILLVDDEQDVTFTIKDILEDNGFKVDTFNDPTIALKSYRINFYDLVILDIKMPVMDGFELYNKLRAKDLRVNICFLTASELYYEEFGKTQFLSCETLGEEFFIQKPITTDNLIKKLNALTNK